MSDKGYEEDAGDADALTKEEEAKCWEAFSAFDKDSSGYIDANELRIVLEMMGQEAKKARRKISSVGLAAPAATQRSGGPRQKISF